MNRNLTFLSLVFLCITLNPLSNLAQNQQWKYFNDKNGLPGNMLLGILNDSKGIFWFGSFNGMSKYICDNPSTWTIFNKSKGLPSDTIYSIIEGNSDTLWIATENGLVKWFNDSPVKIYSIADGLSGKRVYNMKIDDLGFLWCTTNGGISKVKGSEITNWTDDNNFWSLNFDKNGDKWFGLNKWDGKDYIGGLYQYDNEMNLKKIYTVSNTNSQLPSNSVMGIAIDNDGVKWISTFKGVVSLNGSTFTKVDSLIGKQCFGITIDKDNNKWVGTGDTLIGIAKFNGSLFEKYNKTINPIKMHLVYGVYIDNNNNKWFGTRGEGMAVYNENRITPECLISVNIEENKNFINSINFYPNPVTDYININNSTNSKLKAEIYNLMGQNVHTENLNSSNTKINVANLNDGIYFIKLSDKENSTIQKIIVKH